MADLPTGTVTFLFTDLEGSTRLWEQFPDAMKEALARHDEILRDAIAAHDGHIVKMTGDGAHAVFADATHAVRAAVEAQQALTREQWGEPGELRVRMGLHTGPAEARDGDYYGTAVNKAARLMSAANGGQILVSLATEELVRDVVPDDLQLEDLGEHRLRDLSHPERVYQLAAPDLRRDRRRLRTLDAYRGNLPLQSTSFVGRDVELQAVADALATSRLVTITGVGGVGKTRLALQVAAEVVPQFGDGAWLAELAAASDEDAFLQVVASAIGAPQVPGLSLADTLVDYLRPKQLLLVLDNCEHLLEPTSHLAERVLRECPATVLLATSREGFGIPGEQVWPLRSLPVPDTSADTATLVVNEAIRLFEDRAHAVKPAFGVERGNARAVAEICRRLDGMPLAIELAAARVAVMNPDDIARRLDERFRLLTGGRRTAVERHQTLRAAVDWSYSMLAPRDQRVFDRLGVFSGSFDADAVEAIVTDDESDGWDALESLAGLVTKSLVVSEERSVGAARYAMLETLRQYARERLDESGEADDWRRRHAAYYAAVAQTLARGLVSSEEVLWRGRLADERDNLRAAVQWSLDAESDDDLEYAFRSIAYLGYEASTDFGSGIGAWADDALRRVEAAPPELQRAVLAAAGWSAYARGEWEVMRSLGERAAHTGDPTESPSPLLAHYTMATALGILGDSARAREWITDGLRLADAVDDANRKCALWIILAVDAAYNDERELMRDAAERAVRDARGIASPSVLSGALMALGMATVTSDRAAARAALEESITLVEGGAGSMSLAHSKSLLARVYADDAETVRALDLLSEAASESRDQVNRPSQLVMLYRSIPVFATLDRYDAVAALDAFMTRVGNEPAGTALAKMEIDEAQHLGEVARTRLDAEVFRAASERGSSMTIDEMIDFVLVELANLRKGADCG
jgi:predicted ATPase/class 3 adenylate cyclase